MSEPPVQVTADDVHPHAHKTGHSRIDLIIALTAIFLSAVSLFVAIEHGKTEHQLVAANSWPFLGAALSNDAHGGKDVVIAVTNGGVGPAKIKYVEVFYNGKPVATGLDLLRRCCGMPKERAAQKAALPGGYEFSAVDETVLRPGDSDELLVVHRVKDAPDIAGSLAHNLSRLSFKACYCSILDECWIGDLVSVRTAPVSFCPAPDHPYVPDGA